MSRLIIQKTPKEFEDELKKKRIKLILIESFDIGTEMNIIVAENAQKIAEALGIEYDRIEVNPRYHPPWKADIEFYKGDKKVLEVEVKTCAYKHNLERRIRALRRYVRYGRIGVLAIGAGYRKKGQEGDEIGLLMIILTPEIIQMSIDDIVKLIQTELWRKAQEEGYEYIYLASFRDKAILQAWGLALWLSDEVKEIKARMATKEDLSKLERLILKFIEKLEERS